MSYIYQKWTVIETYTDYGIMGMRLMYCHRNASPEPSQHEGMLAYNMLILNFTYQLIIISC